MPRTHAAQRAAEPAARAITHLLQLKLKEEEVVRSYPVILTIAPEVAESTLFRLICRDCTRALEAFGFEPGGRFIWGEYPSEGSMRLDNRIPESVPMIDLPFEASEADPVVSAFRVGDAKEAPHYLVRLRSDPDRLYQTECDDFLRIARGSTATIPITTALRDRWVGAAPAPVLGCSAESRRLPAPAPAEPVAPSLAPLQITSVWLGTRALEGVRSPAYPYVVTDDGRGAKRGFIVDCGSDTPSALRALGIDPASVPRTPASDVALEGTAFGAQPVLRCRSPSGAPILAVASGNESPPRTRLQFDPRSDLVAFACPASESFFASQASTRIDVPYQALGHLNDHTGAHGQTRAFTLGCLRTCASAPAGGARTAGPRLLTRVVLVREVESGAARAYPVVLSAWEADRAWSSAVRLTGSDPARSLAAFGYTSSDVAFAVTYASLAALRADNALPHALVVEDLSLDDVIAAYRVVDAPPDQPPYLVRLRGSPERVRGIACENFLRVARGSLDTTPITSDVLRTWGVARIPPTMGCSSNGVPLPPPPGC